MTAEMLVAAFQGGDKEAFSRLLELFTEEIKGISRKYFIIGGDSSDVQQQAYIGLFKAACDYDPTSGKSFKNFAYMCIVRTIYDEIKKSMRNKRAALNNAASIFLFGDTLEATESPFFQKDDYEALIGFLNQNLSKTEQRVLKCYLEGYTYEDIAFKVGKNQKAVDNALLRIRNKIRKDYIGK